MVPELSPPLRGEGVVRDGSIGEEAPQLGTHQCGEDDGHGKERRPPVAAPREELLF
jgi:hypothetical protein